MTSQNSTQVFWSLYSTKKIWLFTCSPRWDDRWWCSGACFVPGATKSISEVKCPVIEPCKPRLSEWMPRTICKQHKPHAATTTGSHSNSAPHPRRGSHLNRPFRCPWDDLRAARRNAFPLRLRNTFFCFKVWLKAPLTDWELLLSWFSGFSP